MGYLYEISAVLFGVTYAVYVAGFSTPDLLRSDKVNSTEVVRLGLWILCDGFECRNIFGAHNPVPGVIGDWFYIVQGISLGGFFLASVTAVLFIVYLAVLSCRGLGIIKAMVILLIPSVIAQAAALGLFMYKAYDKWMDNAYKDSNNWSNCSFEISTYMLIVYVAMAISVIVCLMLYHKRRSDPVIPHQRLIND